MYFYLSYGYLYILDDCHTDFEHPIYVLPLLCHLRSNYAATKDQKCEIVSIFKFPNDPVLRAQWIYISFQ